MEAGRDLHAKGQDQYQQLLSPLHRIHLGRLGIPGSRLEEWEAFGVGWGFEQARSGGG